MAVVNVAKESMQMLPDENEKNISNEEKNKEPINKNYNIAETFVKVLKDFKSNFVLKEKDDEEGLEQFVRAFYNSSLFDKQIQALAEIVEKAGIKPPFVSKTLTEILYKESDKKIRLLRNLGIIEDDENINANNFLNEDYIKGIESAAKEKGIKVTPEDIYRWLILRPVFYNNDKFLESVKKITGLNDEDIENAMIEEEGFKSYEYSKEKEIEKVFGSMEIMPSGMTFSFSIKRVEESNFDKLKELSERIHIFSPEEAYKNIPSLRNNTVFELFAKNDLISALKKSYPRISDNEIKQIKEYADEIYKKSGIQIVPNEDTPYAIQALYLKQDILEGIKGVINSEEIKKIINEVLKIQNQIKEKTEKYVLTTTVNGWTVLIPDKVLKEIEEKEYELIFKDGEAYYYDGDGEKIKVKLGSDFSENKFEQDKEIMRTLAKTESEFFGNESNKFITGNVYSINDDGTIEVSKAVKGLTSILSKRNGEVINVDGVHYLRTNFDAEYFDSVYGSFSKMDAWHQLITITKQKYGLSSSKEAEDKIKNDGIGFLVIDYSKNDLEKYKREALKALSFVRTNTFLNENGTLKSEFEIAKNNFFADVFTKKEINYFEEESERLINNLQKIKRKINVYRNIMDEAADALFNGVADFAVKNYLDGNNSFKDKKDLLRQLEVKKEMYKNDPDFQNTYGMLKQLIKREVEIEKKIRKNKSVISFIKTNLEQSIDLKLTDNYDEKVNKIFNKSLSHFFNKAFQETSLFKEFVGHPRYRTDGFYSILSFNFNPSNQEKFEEKGFQPAFINIENFGFIHPNRYNLYETDLIELKSAEKIFETILNNSSNASEIEETIKALKNGSLSSDYSKIENLISENRELLDYNLQLEKEPDKIKDFLIKNAGSYNLEEVKKESGIDPEKTLEELKTDELYLLFSKVKRKLGIEWNVYVNIEKQRTIGKSLEIIYKNITKDAIERAFEIKEKYNFPNEKVPEIVKKYAFLKELENEFSLRSQIFKIAFEEKIEGGVYHPVTKEDVIKNLELHSQALKKEMKENGKDDKKIELLYGIENLLLMLQTPKLNLEIQDIKKALIPRGKNNIEKVFGLLKEHVIESSEKIKTYEEVLSKEIEESFRNIENSKYNKYIGMFEQLQKKMKQGVFSYDIEKLLKDTFFKKLDETTINNYKNRLTEENNIISNLNSLYGDMVYKAVKKSYDALSTKKQIEELLDLSKKGLLPLMVKDGKESFVMTITEKEAETLYHQYRKIFNKIKNDYVNDKGELSIPERVGLSEEEKEFIKQLYLLNKIGFPHNKSPNKKEELNVIMGLMFTLNGSPLIEKEDISLSDKRAKISKRLDEKFPFLKGLDKKLVTLNFYTSDMSVSKYQKLKESISPDNFVDYDDDKNKESFAYLVDNLETKLLTISTEIDTLDGRMKTIKSEMMSMHEKYERTFNEKLRNNRALNGSAFDNAFNFVRFPLLMVEAFQIGVEAAKQVIGEYFEYRRKILPLKEEINKRKEDLIIFMNEAQKTEESIATEIQDFYVGFYSQNYNTIEEMITIIEKMQKDGNKFAEHILSNPSIAIKDEEGKVISIDIDNLDKELKKTKNLLYGVYRTSKGGYRNIESLARARSRIKAIFAESQPSLFTMLFGSKDMIYYDEIADFRIRKIFKSKFEIKENAKHYLVGKVEKENVETLRKYIDIDKILFHINKFKKNTLIRSSNGSLVLFNIDEKALSEFRKQLTKQDKNITLEEAMEKFINMSSLYTIDYKNFSDVNNIIKSLKNNSELSNRIEEHLVNDEKIEKIAKANKQDFFKTKEELKDAIFKAIINMNILTEKEQKLLSKVGISQNDLEKFIQRKEVSNLVQQSLHKVYFNTTKRFFEKEEDKDKYASSNFEEIAKDAKHMSEEEFKEKYKINTDEIENIKNKIKKDIIDIVIDNVDLNDYELVKKEKKFGGGKISNTTKLLAEDGSKVVKETYFLFNNIGDRIKEIASIDGMRHKAKINKIKKVSKNKSNAIDISN